MNPVTFPPCPRPRADQPWIMHAPVISSGHFSQADRDIFYDPENALMVSADGADTLICIEDHEHMVMRHVTELGYAYLRISCDGERVAGLPLFE